MAPSSATIAMARAVETVDGQAAPNVMSARGKARYMNEAAYRRYEFTLS